MVDNNTTGNASTPNGPNSSTMPEGNSVVLPHAHTTIIPSSSTLSPLMSAMAIPTIPTSLPPLTAIVSESEKENRRQDTESGMDSMPSETSLSVGSISNSVQSEQCQSLPKRVKGLAVVGTQLIDKCVISQ